MATLVTQGWDLVAAITGSALNDLISDLYDAGTIPPTFTEPFQIPNVMDGSVSAAIGAPTVDLSPANSTDSTTQASITFPFQSGSIETTAGGPYTFPMNTNVTITTDLQYVNVALTSGTSAQLTLDFTSPNAVSNLSITGTDPDWDDKFDPIIASVFLTFLQTNLPASITLGSVTLPSSVQPLAPSGTVDFAIQPNQPSGDNTLLLLATLSDGTAGSTDFSTSSPVLGTGQESAVIVSNRALIEDAILPGLAQQLNLQTSDFTVTVSSSGSYTLSFNGDQQISGDYSPELVSLSVYVNDNGQIQVDYDAHAHPLFDIGETYYIDVTGSIFGTPSLDPSSQTLSFNIDAPTPNAEVQASTLGKALLAAAVALSFGTIGVFLAAVAAAVVPYLVTHINFGALLSNASPTLANVTLSFQWPAASTYTLSSVSLPGDLIVIGQPVAS